jgi:hypothetical protein
MAKKKKKNLVVSPSGNGEPLLDLFVFRKEDSFKLTWIYL